MSSIPHDLNNIMHKIRHMLAKIASHIFSSAGFLDKELHVLRYESSDILKYAQDCLIHENVLTILDSETISKTLKILDQYGFLITHNKESVDSFHQIALANGATCNGKPGFRPQYEEGYYAAFVIDLLDGHNIEAVYCEK